MMRILFASTTLALLSLGLADDALAGKKTRGEAFLVRPDPAPDADANGRVKWESEANKDKDKLEVKAKDLDPLGSYSVFIEDAAASGVFVLLGAMTLDDDSEDPGEFKLKFDEKAVALPLGVASVTELVDRKVEVRDGAAAAVLVGAMPDVATGKKGFKHKKADLEQPLVVVDANAKGRVEVWYKGKDGRQRFRVQAEKLDPIGTYTVAVEDAVGSGVFVVVGTMALDDDADSNGEFKLFLDTKKGDPMPQGVAHVDELAGRAVRLVDGTLTPVLEGVVPDLIQ